MKIQAAAEFARSAQRKVTPAHERQARDVKRLEKRASTTALTASVASKTVKAFTIPKAANDVSSGHLRRDDSMFNAEKAKRGINAYEDVRDQNLRNEASQSLGGLDLFA